MTASIRRTVPNVVGRFAAVVFLITGSTAWADVGLPIGIRMPRDTPQAVAGQEFRGRFLVHVFKAGTLDRFQVAGEGWNVIAVTPPAAPASVQPGVIEIPFRAIPGDTEKRIGLTLTYNGQTVHRSYILGAASLGRNIEQHRLRRIDDDRQTIGPAAPGPGDQTTDQTPSREGGGRAQSIHVTGRIVYTRPCRDLRDPNTGDPPDGDCDDPWDMPARTIGVDGLDVRLLDNDTVGSEEMWSGYTDVNGYFDTGVFPWEGSDFDPDPDLVIYAETEVAHVVDVTDDSVGEYTYSFQTPEVTDFTGSSYDFGTLTPADSGMYPALHIFNSISRAHRYVTDVPVHDLPKVQVMWPDDSRVGGAWYERNWDPPEIHISTQRQWREETHTHEYGHHYIHSLYTAEFPEPDYCNAGTAYCDYASGVPGCYGSDAERCGHCEWCPETDHDAFGEGFPDWLADVVTRDYPARYTFDDGTAFTALFGRSEEGIAVCCQDGQTHNPFLTEGFVAALLRDIEDETQDDHDTDGIMDSLCTGPTPIFHVVDNTQPITINNFISGFRASFPEYADELYPTAFNVSPQFVAGFPADTAPPSAVAYVSSPSHPLLTGGPLPCITVQWLPADDDRGACFYSFDWSQSPAGVEPNNTPHTLTTSGCYLQTSGYFFLGPWWFSIKAQDCPDENGAPGAWGPTATFGPFEVTDCNGSGDLDICDIRCCDAGCVAGPANCQSHICHAGSCGTSEDCNGNYAPDECDLADGTSEDCNRNAMPDECENMSHWSGTSGSWHAGPNWLEGTPPTSGAEVCVDVPGDETVTFSQNTLEVGTLACSESLNINGGPNSMSPPTVLTLDNASWVDGDLGLVGFYTSLEVNDRLDIGGQFRFSGIGDTRGAKLTGPGTTYANGGLQINNVVYIDNHHLVTDSHGTSVCTGRIDLPGASVFEIRPGSTYEFQGDGGILNGWSDDNFVNEGTLIKSLNTGVSTVYVHTENSGLIHVQAGTLKFYLGGNSTGDFLADPGTAFEFYGGHAFQPTSSIVAENVSFPDGGHTIKGTYNVSHATTVQAFTVTFTSEANIINYGPSFYIRRGTVNFDAVIGGPIHFDTLSLGPGATGDGIAAFNSGDPVEVTNLINGPGVMQSVGTVTVTGPTTWNAGGEFGGTGTVNANADVLVNTNGDQKVLKNCTFNNAATATFLGGFGRSSAVFNNLETGVLDIQFDGGVLTGYAQPTNNAGTMVKTAGDGTSTIQASMNNTGTIEVQTGVLRFYTGYGGHCIQTAGQTVLNGGGLRVDPGSFQVGGGVLTGAGTITGNVVVGTDATVAPGLSAGVLSIAGNYTQATGGTLEIEIGGLNQGTEYDQIIVSGTAGLGGNLQVILPDSGFAPAPGDRFQIITAGTVTGRFDPVNVANLPTNMIVDVIYTATSVTLSVASAVPGDCDLDGEVDLNDFALFEACLLGPGGGLGAGCRCFDVDADLDVDLTDGGTFTRQFGG